MKIKKDMLRVLDPFLNCEPLSLFDLLDTGIN